MRKNTTSIPILGLENNLSNDSLTDGMCETLLNMRNRRGEWRSMCDFTRTSEIADSSYTIIHRHNVLPENYYICQQDAIIALCLLQDGEFVVLQEITTVNSSLTCNVTTYGNVLHITQADYFDETYIYKKGDEKYITADVGSIEPPTITLTDYTFSRPSDIEYFTFNNETHILCKIAEISQYEPVSGDDEQLDRTDYYNTYLDGQTNKTWCFFAAYKMYDGSTIKMSEVLKISSASEFVYFTKETTNLSAREYKYTFYADLKKFEPTINVTHNLTDDQKELIDSIVIYATRDIAELLFEDIDDAERKYTYYLDSDGAAWSKIDSSEILNEEKAIESTFYEVEELELDENEFTFDYEDYFTYIETNATYEANFTHLDKKTSNKLYYNNRLHEWDMKMTFSEPRIFLPTSDVYWEALSSKLDYYGVNTDYPKISNATLMVGVLLEVDNEYLYATSEIEVYSVTVNNVEYIRLPSILTYPDYRAKTIRLTLCKGLVTYSTVFEGTMTSVTANNMAYCEISEAESYVALTGLSTMTPLTGNSTYYVDNVIYISESDNPFIFDLSTTLTVNGEQIIRLAVALDQLAESKFGENPLYIFTTEGIHIAEIGSGDIFYSRTFPFNQDVVINTAPIITLNGVLIYITNAGVKIISKSSDNVISTALHDSQGTFLTECKGFDFGVYHEHYNEIILFNSSSGTDIAYVYSLSNNVWTNRQFDTCNVISLREIANSTGIYDLSLEEDYTAPMDVHLVTRRLKLGNNEFKRIETFLARTTAVDSHIILYGSNDGFNWVLLRCGTQRRLRRTSQSYRYYKIEMLSSASLTTLTVFEVEYRNRFVNHLS